MPGEHNRSFAPVNAVSGRAWTSALLDTLLFPVKVFSLALGVVTGMVFAMLGLPEPFSEP